MKVSKANLEFTVMLCTYLFLKCLLNRHNARHSTSAVQSVTQK